jgi:hypothetical protein
MAAMSANHETKRAKQRKSRSGSETRRKSDQIALRLKPEQRRFLKEEARRRGLNSAQELILQQLESIFSDPDIAVDFPAAKPF